MPKRPRRSDPEKRKSVRKRAAAAAKSPLRKAGRAVGRGVPRAGARAAGARAAGPAGKTVRGPNSARMINMLEGRVSPRTTAVHEYAKGYAKGGPARKWAAGKFPLGSKWSEGKRESARLKPKGQWSETTTTDPTMDTVNIYLNRAKARPTIERKKGESARKRAAATQNRTTRGPNS